MSIVTTDIDSPGFEYIRAYESMCSLYHKLILLDYRVDFCSRYKCPSIHRYYFATASKNQTEQQFIFICLCAWLIRDKCQMNVELEPEDYQDPDVTVGLILESLRLILDCDISIPLNRLKQGYGPEVICALNILADQSLDLKIAGSPYEGGQTKVIYNNKTNSDVRYITIGQPFVGGGLTTRPLGNYKIDDTSLLFPPDELDEGSLEPYSVDLGMLTSIDPAEWLVGVNSCKDSLISVMKSLNRVDRLDVTSQLETLSKSRSSVEQFESISKNVIDVVLARINSQMESISDAETKIKTALGDRLERFVELQTMVNRKAELLRVRDGELQSVNRDIQLRRQDLNDTSKLLRLKDNTGQLKAENSQMDLEIGLLLTIYAKRHKDLMPTC